MSSNWSKETEYHFKYFLFPPTYNSVDRGLNYSQFAADCSAAPRLWCHYALRCRTSISIESNFFVRPSAVRDYDSMFLVNRFHQFTVFYTKFSLFWEK